jgi:hypothetical protein
LLHQNEQTVGLLDDINDITMGGEFLLNDDEAILMGEDYSLGQGSEYKAKPSYSQHANTMGLDNEYPLDIEGDMWTEGEYNNH